MINVIGNIFGTSGYAKHTRNLANALNKQVPVRLMTALMEGWERHVNDEELLMIKRQTEESYDTNLIITHPLHWKQNCWAKNNIVYLVWEGDKVPGWIAESCMDNKINTIIVPSEHTKIALEKTIKECLKMRRILKICGKTK